MRLVVSRVSVMVQTKESGWPKASYKEWKVGLDSGIS